MVNGQSSRASILLPYSQKTVRRAVACILSRCDPLPATIAPAGSSRNDDEGNEIVEAFNAMGRPRSRCSRLPRANGRASQGLSSRSSLSQANFLSPSIRPSPSPVAQGRGLLRLIRAEPTTFVRDIQRCANKKSGLRLFATLVQDSDDTGRATPPQGLSCPVLRFGS
jgi:hypothetical protein